MSKILGMDLGSNSVGYAIREVNKKGNQIVKKGVLRFRKGVASEKGIDFPMVKKRTESRGKRRNYQSEKYRKFELLEFLKSHNMCPLTQEELNDWKKYRKGQKRKYPSSKDFINWLRFDFDGDGKPDFHLFNKDKHESNYIFRALAVSEKKEDIDVFKNNPHILGRVLYQLVQRRGFKGRDEAEAKTMLEGSKKDGTAGRNEIDDYIKKYKTLGAALYYFQKETGKRIRKRYNLRKDYETELKEICKIHNINDYAKLYKAIIWQRPLRTQKGLIGLCTYEKNKRRVAVSHPIYQEYRVWIQINNLKITAPEGENQEKFLKEIVYPLFIKKTDFQIKKIVDEVQKKGGKIASKYATSKKAQKTKVLALSNFYDFEKIFGKDWKNKLKFNDIYNRDAQPKKKEEKGYTIEDIWHVLNTFDDAEKIVDFAKNKLHLSEENIERFSKIKFNQGYVTLSLSAVKKILPYLQKGIKYSDAVYLANLHKVLGRDISEEMIESFIKDVSDITQQVNKEKQLNFIINSLIKSHLEDDYRYFIEDNRELDESEKTLIYNTLKKEIGEITWDALTKIEQQGYIDYVAENYRGFLKRKITDKKDIFKPVSRLHEAIFKSLQKKYGLKEDKIKFLWHPSEQEKYENAKLFEKISVGNKTIFLEESKVDDFLNKNNNAFLEGVSMKLLGNPQPLSKGFKQPMALKTMHKLKKLVNYLLQTHQIDEDTKVVVEIARELNDNNMRAAIKTYQTRLEKENNKYEKIIREYNDDINANFNPKEKKLHQRLKLWEEQGKVCLYTGKAIGIREALNGAKYDLEHTIPLSMSFDSRLENLTLADKGFNNDVKGKKIPTQLSNYKEIEPRIQFMKDKIEKLENNIKDNLIATKYVIDKAAKDRKIQDRHLLKFELKYWKEKYFSFTCREYKPNFKNSQLKDTQIVTKYALPYLKTVFNRVVVQKGTVTNIFKEIYNVKFTDEKKDRSFHYHHAVDAAILTLIPDNYQREKLLEQYFKAKERDLKFHTQPIDWDDFKVSYIKNIEKSILTNYLTEDRITTQTYKKVRKRGKVVYTIDSKGNKKPRIAKGGTIRGQLHSESFYGAIKQPLRNEEGKIQFDDNNKMILKDEIRLVSRKKLKYKGTNDTEGFKNLAEIEKVIVDKDLFNQIQQQVSPKTFKEDLETGVWMLDKKGNKVNQIKKIRCFESLKYETAVQVHQHQYKTSKTKKPYKEVTYSQNGENPYCLFYEGKIKGKVNKKIKILSLFEIAKTKLKDVKEVFELDIYNNLNGLPLKKIFKKGDRVIFYKERKEELPELDNIELFERIYEAYQFETDGRIKFKHHLLAGDLTEAKKTYKEESKLSFEKYEPLLRLTSKNWNFIIENKDFEIKLDGTIEFKY